MSKTLRPIGHEPADMPTPGFYVVQRGGDYYIESPVYGAVGYYAQVALSVRDSCEHVGQIAVQAIHREENARELCDLMNRIGRDEQADADAREREATGS